MLTIKITPDRLIFNNLNEEIYKKLSLRYDFEEDQNGMYIEGRAGELYKILLKLSFDYDIEIV